MQMPQWSEMDQKQRIMLVGSVVVLVAAVGLIGRSLLGGGGGGTVETPPAAVEAINASAAAKDIKPPPELTPQDIAIDEVPEGSKKGVQPEGG